MVALRLVGGGLGGTVTRLPVTPALKPYLEYLCADGGRAEGHTGAAAAAAAAAQQRSVLVPCAYCSV
jgi:hypothetical protein